MGGAGSSSSSSGGGGAAAADPAALAARARAFGAWEVDQVVAGTGCADRERIARVLEDCGGSTDQAIELLVEQLGQEEEEEADGGVAAGAAAASAGTAASGQQQGERQQAGAASPGTEQAGRQQAAAQQELRRQAGAILPSDASTRVTAEQWQRQCGDDCIRLELRKHPADPHRITAALLAAGAPGERQQQPAAVPPDEQQQEQLAGAAAEEAAAEEAAAEEASDSKGRKRVSGSRRGVKLKGGKVAAHPARNQRCPCGSTRKYKNCCLHGAKQQEAAGKASPASSGASTQMQVLYI